MSPQVLSIIHVSLPPHERRLAFGIFGVVVGLGAFAGNVLGGELINADIWGLSWRPIFLVNLPIGMIALLGAHHWVRETRSPHARKLDPGGVVLATVTLFLMVFPFVEGREAGWPLWTFFCLGASVPLMAAVHLLRTQGARSGRLTSGRADAVSRSHVRHRPHLHADLLRRSPCLRAHQHGLSARRGQTSRPRIPAASIFRSAWPFWWHPCPPSACRHAWAAASSTWASA